MTRVPGVASLAFGADGFFLVALTGPGQIWLQSMPPPVLAHALEPYLGRLRPVAIFLRNGPWRQP